MVEMRRNAIEGMAQDGIPRPSLFYRIKHLSAETQLLGGGLLVLTGPFVYPYLEGFLERVTPGCLFHRVTGVPCLLCGMTRSLAATAHGRLVDAFRLHLLGPPLYATVFCVTALLLAEKVLGRRVLPTPRKGAWRRWGWAALALLFAAWVAKLLLFGVNV